MPDHDRHLVRRLCKDLLPGHYNRRVREKGGNSVIRKMRAMIRHSFCRYQEDVESNEEKYEVEAEEQMEGQGQGRSGMMNEDEDEDEDLKDKCHVDDDCRGRSRSSSRSRSRSQSRSRSRRDTNIDIDDYEGAQIGLDLGYCAVTDKYKNIGYEKENLTRNNEKKNENENPIEMEVETQFIEVKKKLSFATDENIDIKENLMERRGHELISVDSNDFINIMTNENITINTKKKIINDDKSNKNIFGDKTHLKIEHQFENPNLLSNQKKRNEIIGDMEETRNVVHNVQNNEQPSNSQSQSQFQSLSPSAISPYSSSNLRGSLTSIIHRNMALNTYNESISRALESNVDQFLITKFRILFLGVLRLNYMKQIKCGRLPRRSRAALILLNSIDVGMATVHTDGLQDWDAVKVKCILLFFFFFFLFFFFLLILTSSFSSSTSFCC